MSNPGQAGQNLDDLVAEVARKAAASPPKPPAEGVNAPLRSGSRVPEPEDLEAIEGEMGTKGRPTPWPLSWAGLQALASSYPDELGTRCVWWLYETGQRVGEAVNTYRKNVEIQTTSDGREYLSLTSVTEKSFKRARAGSKRARGGNGLVQLQTPWRVIPMPLFGREKPVVELLWASLQDLKPDDRVLLSNRFKIGYQVRKAEIVTKAFDRSLNGGRGDWVPDYRQPAFPHYFRSVRATHLQNDRGNSFGRQPDGWLQKFFGWKSASMPGHYAKFGGSELIEGIA